MNRRQVIDLVSDDEDDIQAVAPPPNRPPPPALNIEDDVSPLPLLSGHRAATESLQAPLDQPAKEEELLQRGDYHLFGDELVWVPDDSAEPAPQPTAYLPTLPELVMPAPIVQPLTRDGCLARVLDIFPDVNHEHVLQLYAELGEGDLAIPSSDRYANIVTKLIEADSYPKQSKGKQTELKRRPEDDLKENDFKRWEGADRQLAERMLRGPIASALKADFPDIPRATIAKQVAQHQYLFQTYVALAAMRDARSTGWTGRPSNGATADIIVSNTGVPGLLDELSAARKRVSTIRSERTIELARRQAEEENLKRAIMAGETAECQACFDDLPMNRQIHCNGDSAHFTCFDCAIRYIKSEVGQSRCGVMCTAGCGAGYAHAQLHLLEDKVLIAKLEQLQQEKDIRDAELDDLAECPFCDYKAILPPIEEDFEFRCANPDCEKVSCRRCKAASHTPASCEENAKDNKLTSRHQIEEAMTAALIRKCGKCSKPFIKDFGCNKMSCPSCGNLQCYVCSASVKDYKHFDQNAAGGRNTVAGSAKKLCPLYDNVEERHEREIKEAEAKARAEAMAANPDITEDDLKIKESDAVREATQDKIRRLAGANGAVPGILGGRYGLLNFRAGLGDDDLADLADEDDDAPLERIAAIQRGVRAQREARVQMEVARRRLAARPLVLQQQLEQPGNAPGIAEVARVIQRPRQALGAHAVAAAPRLAEAAAEAVDLRGPLRHGLGGHIAAHGVQAHLARPWTMFQGLARLHPYQAPQMGMPNMIGYMPMYGMQMPEVGRFPQQAPAALPAPMVPQVHGAPQAYPYAGGHRPGAARAVHAADAIYANPVAPVAPADAAGNNRGPGHVVDARNNGVRGLQGLFDAFLEDQFGLGDAAPLGLGRIGQGEDAPRPFPEMLAPGQPRDHALDRNAQPEPRVRHDALDYTAAREGQRHALQHVDDRAGGGGDV